MSTSLFPCGKTISCSNHLLYNVHNVHEPQAVSNYITKGIGGISGISMMILTFLATHLMRPTLSHPPPHLHPLPPTWFEFTAVTGRTVSTTSSAQRSAGSDAGQRRMRSATRGASGAILGGAVPSFVERRNRPYVSQGIFTCIYRAFWEIPKGEEDFNSDCKI